MLLDLIMRRRFQTSDMLRYSILGFLFGMYTEENSLTFRKDPIAHRELQFLIFVGIRICQYVQSQNVIGDILVCPRQSGELK